MSVTHHVRAIGIAVVGIAVSATMFTAVQSPAQAATTAAVPKPTPCAARSVAQEDARTYSSLSTKALVSVASYNIQGAYAAGAPSWNSRRAGVRDMVSRCMPDVLGLQEASAATYMEIPGKTGISQYEDLVDLVNGQLADGGFSDQYHVTNLYRDVCNHAHASILAEWDGTWRGSPDAPWRYCSSDPDRSTSTFDTRIIYNNRTVELISRSRRLLSSRNVTSSPRYLSWAKFRHRDTGRLFIVSTTHLEASATDAFRVTEIDQALSTLAAARVEGDTKLPTFLVGDLNSSRYSENFTAADQVKAAGYTDIIGNDRRWKSNHTGKGSCTRLSPTAPRVPWLITDRDTTPSRRFVNPIYNTSNKGENFCGYRDGIPSRGLVPRADWWKLNGSAIDYIFVSGAVRARTWETVVNAAVGSSGLPSYSGKLWSDHNMIMTYAFV